MQLIKEHVTEYNENYRRKMKIMYDKRRDVDVTKLPQVGARVFMKLPTENLEYPDGSAQGLSGRAFIRTSSTKN